MSILINLIKGAGQLKTFSANSANEVWKDVFLELKEGDGVFNENSRMGDVREILHVSCEISNPLNRWVTARVPAMNPAFALIEAIWMITGRDETYLLDHWFPKYSSFVNYEKRQHGAYGPRLRTTFGLDQLRRLYDVLKNNPKSRQGVLQIWSARDDLPYSSGEPSSGSTPCNLVSSVKVRNGKLYWLQFMRSNDIDRGFPHNIIQFTLLQEVVAGWLGLELGSYTHVVDSMHHYKDLSKRAKIDSVVEYAANSDGFHEDFYSSMDTFEELALHAEYLAKNTRDALVYAENILHSSLPVAFRNMWAIILADHLRRSGHIVKAKETAFVCNNPALLQAWKRWAKT